MIIHEYKRSLGVTFQVCRVNFRLRQTPSSVVGSVTQFRFSNNETSARVIISITRISRAKRL